MTRMWSKHGEVLDGEIDVIWLQDTAGLPYVREVVWSAPTRRRPPARNVRRSGRMIGYTIVAADAPRDYGGYFRRRYFYVAAHDASEDPDSPYLAGGMPCEGVAPSAVSLPFRATP